MKKSRDEQEDNKKTSWFSFTKPPPKSDEAKEPEKESKPEKAPPRPHRLPY